MTDYDAAYYAKREEQERALADQALDSAIARIHLEMAGRYATLARTAGDARRTSQTRPKLQMAAGKG